MLEATLQQVLVSTIRMLYPNLLIALSLSGTQLNGSPEEKARIIEVWKKQGFIKGLPDMTLYVPNGVTIQMELKVGYNKQSKDQLDVESTLNTLGHNYFIVRDVQTGMDLIAEHTTIEYRQLQYDLYGSKLPIPKNEILKYYNLKD